MLRRQKHALAINRRLEGHTLLCDVCQVQQRHHLCGINAEASQRAIRHPDEPACMLAYVGVGYLSMSLSSDLKATRVGEHATRPVDELMQTAHLIH